MRVSCAYPCCNPFTECLQLWIVFAAQAVGVTATTNGWKIGGIPNLTRSLFIARQVLREISRLTYVGGHAPLGWHVVTCQNADLPTDIAPTVSHLMMKSCPTAEFTCRQ